MTRRVTRKRVPPKGGPTGVLVEVAEKPKEAQHSQRG